MLLTAFVCSGSKLCTEATANKHALHCSLLPSLNSLLSYCCYFSSLHALLSPELRTTPTSSPLHHFDLVGSSCVCFHTCALFYPHRSHCGNTLTDSCTSKICSLSCTHGYHMLLGDGEKEREGERGGTSLRQPDCVVGPI